MRSVPYQMHVLQQQYRGATHACSRRRCANRIPGLFANALLRFGDQFVTLAELGCAGLGQTSAQAVPLHAVRDTS